MIRQIRFRKGECGWVNFPNGAIKPGVVYGNEVINVSSRQTEGFRDGTRTSPGEKDHSCAFVIMQQVSEQGEQLVPLGIPIQRCTGQEWSPFAWVPLLRGGKSAILCLGFSVSLTASPLVVSYGG